VTVTRKNPLLCVKMQTRTLSRADAAFSILRFSRIRSDSSARFFTGCERNADRVHRSPAPNRHTNFREPTGPTKLLIAKTEFELAMDVPVIAAVILWGAPKTLLDFWKSAVRAGRDGRLAFCKCYMFKRNANKSTPSLSLDKCLREQLIEQFMVNDDLKAESDEMFQDRDSCRSQLHIQSFINVNVSQNYGSM
jgi:hypothetical protein